MAQDAGPGNPAAPQPAAGEAAVAPAPQILVSGIGSGSAAAAAVQRIIDEQYALALAAAGHVKSLNSAQSQALADRITAALHQAGYPAAQAYTADQLVAFKVGGAGAVAPAVAAAAAPAPAAPAAPAPPAVATLAPNVLPAVRDRETDAAQEQKIAVSGFRVQGVGEHRADGITPASMQGLADAQLKALGGGGEPAQLTFGELQEVADKLTERYRQAGFIVATAFLPEQTIGDDHMVDIHVLEGTIGKIIVKGTKRYRPGVISAPAEKLRGKPLQKNAVDTALLYDRDLPGVTVTSTFQPGEKTGETDLLMVAREAKRPVTFTVGENNYGNELTGLYRTQFGVSWASPLGIGDRLDASIDYALVPSGNVLGSLQYSAPTVVVPGLSAVIGGSRSQLQINTGSFTALDIKGPSSMYFTGMDWSFKNTDTLKMQGTFHVLNEQSKLRSKDIPLSDERFNVAELGFGMNHTDQRFNGIDLVQFTLRKSLSDNSAEPDLVAPDHASSFLAAKLAYTRLQLLTKSQRVYFKFIGQYTNDALVPMEQLALGGPDSVRAYPIANAMSDRGYYTALEYHVDAPGFGDVVSPFYGRPWRELLELEAFYDYGKGFPAGANRLNRTSSATLSGVGAGFVFRLPRFHNFEFHLTGSVPTSSQKASDDNGYHIYARFGITF